MEILHLTMFRAFIDHIDMSGGPGESRYCAKLYTYGQHPSDEDDVEVWGKDDAAAPLGSGI